MFKNSLLVLLITTVFKTACISNGSLKFLGEDSKNSYTKNYTANVRYNLQQGTYRIEYGELDVNAAAYGTYKMSLEETGWDTLTISSYQGSMDKYNDDTKAFAMGYLEGFLTSARIWNHYTNLRYYYFFEDNFTITERVKDFLIKNLNWMKNSAILQRYSDPYWYHVYTVIRQMEGMVEGYNSAVEFSKRLTYAEFQIMNASGDLDELGFWDSKKIPNFKSMSVEEIVDYIEAHSHCSALIKLAPDFSDIWFGHNTWTTFSSMIRIFKEYRFTSSKGTEKSKAVAFSGYPGAISSIDDFYITDKDLYVTETTNQIFEEDLYKELKVDSILTWLRTIIANRLSDNGKEWTEIFSRFDSGTYNNQFQILDLKLIDTDNKIVNDNALWIIEQIPGYYESADVTTVLRYGYWPSYNSPYFKQIRKISGYDNILIEKPELKDKIDYDTCARANILRRDQHNVVDMESYKKLIRYNNYKIDPLSKNNPTWAIACRSDFSDNPECRGATDAKFASIKDIKNTNKKKITIISGPTNDYLDSFDYSTAKCASKPQYVFNGLSKNLNYQWTEYVTSLFE